MIENAIEAVVDSLDIDFSDFFTEANSAESLIGMESLGNSFHNTIQSIDSTTRSLYFLEPGVNTTLTQDEIISHMRELQNLRIQATTGLTETANQYSTIVDSASTSELEQDLANYNEHTKDRLEDKLQNIKEKLSEIKKDIYMHGGDKI